MRPSPVLADAFARRADLSPEDLASLAPHVEAGLAELDRGTLRAAYWDGERWRADEDVKKVVLLSFLTRQSRLGASSPHRPRSFDKHPLKFEDWGEPEFTEAQIRIVPGAVVRHGAYVARGAVLMPCFVNIGAYIGQGTMIDTWATVGSCAQIGARCHVSGGAGIGGVLEPLGDVPVVIEDDVFIGARSEIAEGVWVRSGAVIGMGVFLGRSTPIVDRASGDVVYGTVPENAVVVPGARADPRRPELSVYAAVIVKYVDERTRAKTALNELARHR